MYVYDDDDREEDQLTQVSMHSKSTLIRSSERLTVDNWKYVYHHLKMSKLKH